VPQAPGVSARHLQLMRHSDPPFHVPEGPLMMN
jgi:hypothetical protein